MYHPPAYEVYAVFFSLAALFALGLAGLEWILERFHDTNSD